MHRPIFEIGLINQAHDT